MKYLLLFLIASNFALAQSDPYKLTKEELSPETEEVLVKKPEKYLRHESMIYDFNTDLGLKDQRHYTGTDRNRLAVSGHVSGDYEHFNDIIGYELNYMRKSERYNQIWYGLQFFQHRSFFDSITQNHPAEFGANPNAESQIQRPNNMRVNLFAAGLGAGYRFKLLMAFWPTESVFETIDVFANFLTMDESFVDRKYTGYGLTTSYGIHRRAGDTFFYGGKFSYNIAAVTREAIGTEKKDDRSFALGWLSLGLEMGIFF